MPKYVLKEDVEKGLVDPTLSLDEQPAYKKKVEERNEEKEKHQPKKPQHQRPKKERAPRKERPKFNWDKKEITADSKPLEKPNKLIEKPDAKKHKDGFQKFQAEREVLKAERNAIFDEQKAVIRSMNENKKNGREVNTQYSGVMKQRMGLENQMRRQIRALDDQKKVINGEMEFLRAKADQLRRPSSSQGYSVQILYQMISEKEHQLTTASIGKKQQAKLSNQINELKRSLAGARSYIDIESDLNKLDDQIQMLYDEVKPIKKELHVKITQANIMRAEIEELKGQLKTEKGAVQDLKSIDDIKAEYDVKLKVTEGKKDKLEDKIDDYMDKNVRANDEFEDQQDLIRYIDWVENQVAYMKKRKEDDDKWAKEKEAREKKKLKEKEDYLKREEERKKRDEKKKEDYEKIKAKKVQSRELFINRNPNFQIINLCSNLIEYCQNLKPAATYQYQDTKGKNQGDITFDKTWKQQTKKGALEIVVPKRANQDEEAHVKKQPKNKKKEEKVEDQKFEHGIEIANQFQEIKLLPPSNVAEIDSTIKLINDKVQFYSNPTEEEKTAFKEKAIQQWDQRSGDHEARKQGGGKYKERTDGDSNAVSDSKQEEEPKREKKDARKGKKNQVKEGDFPELA